MNLWQPSLSSDLPWLAAYLIDLSAYASWFPVVQRPELDHWLDHILVVVHPGACSLRRLFTSDRLPHSVCRGDSHSPGRSVAFIFGRHSKGKKLA